MKWLELKLWPFFLVDVFTFEYSAFLKMNSFSESQKFRQWWLWAILIAATVLPASAAFIALLNHTGGMTTKIFACTMVMPVIIIALFIFFELRTVIDEIGISYQFFPIQLKPRLKRWEDIEKADVRTYSPLSEFGGCGLRYTFGNGTAYNVSGNMGLQIVFKNGKKLLVGTQRPEEINELLRRLNKVPNS